MLSRTCTAICEGQWLDLEFENRASVSEEEYMEMIEKKTGVLYGASAGMGAFSPGLHQSGRGLDEFGRLTGMGFQLQDDVIDLTAPRKFWEKDEEGTWLRARRH